jgi:hypothetical protein
VPHWHFSEVRLPWFRIPGDGADPATLHYGSISLTGTVWLTLLVKTISWSVLTIYGQPENALAPVRRGAVATATTASAAGTTTATMGESWRCDRNRQGSGSRK